MCHLHETQLKYKDWERLQVKVRKEINQTHNENNKTGDTAQLSDRC